MFGRVGVSLSVIVDLTSHILTPAVYDRILLITPPNVPSRGFCRSSGFASTASFFVNIMRDVPNQDTQPEKYSHLLVCMFKPFFTVADLDCPGMTLGSLPWDELTTSPLRTAPFRQNISGLLQQSLAAEKESAKRRAVASAARVNRPSSTEGGSLGG